MTTKTALARTALMAGLLIGLTVGVPTVTANATPAGQTQEDDPGWDCRTMGDLVCGPTNAQGVSAGCYSDGGALVAEWPCYVIINQAGDADVYTPDAR